MQLSLWWEREDGRARAGGPVLYLKSTDFISEAQRRCLTTMEFVFFFSSLTTSLESWWNVLLRCWQPSNETGVVMQAWPTNVSTAICLNNNSVVCRCLTRGRARTPFKSHNQFPLECALFPSNGRYTSALLRGPIKLIDCFTLWMINKVQRKIRGEKYFFHKSRSSLVWACRLWDAAKKNLGDSRSVNMESFSFTEQPHTSPRDMWTCCWEETHVDKVLRRVGSHRRWQAHKTLLDMLVDELGK